MSYLKELTIKKRTTKAKVTRFRSYLETLQDRELEQIEMSGLQTRLANLMPALTEFENIYTSLLSQTTEDPTMDEEYAELEELENKYYACVRDAKQLLGTTSSNGILHHTLSESISSENPTPDDKAAHIQRTLRRLDTIQGLLLRFGRQKGRFDLDRQAPLLKGLFDWERCRTFRFFEGHYFELRCNLRSAQRKIRRQ